MGEANRRDIVLLVDDSPEALGFLTDALEEAGFSVLIATSGHAALSIVDRISPDVILLDAVMPGIDGFETCTRLKANPAVAQVPVIFMTGLTETEHVVKALECGGVDYLAKPINIDELRARIRVHLSNAKSAQSARVALDAAGRHLLAVRGNGTVHWTTPQASHLIDAATGASDGISAVATATAAWLIQRRPDSGQDSSFAFTSRSGQTLQLSFLGTIGTDEYLFRLTAANRHSDDELLRHRFGLTQRESEVLVWIARGKANRDIGEILGLSSRTVNKHLEQIYAKLGVENRASAAVRAAQVLHES
ncbi:response regulator transcription factor [Peteryoungia desertarenae]|uniref:Response regulator transcription factor n=1 Tax=Peteryoungia desertarenae TaxID=1813451 RepID=A0ABX6QRG2_9HYPH|nr:response regulator transcription factor [Peteryoungia desertarenae]QLF71099.1 response regulator transcription factor [Peteryoungia desertarenae]